ncbi:hypothetical protein GDO86_020494, partial [Hymenochirus boettgeri]
NIFTFLLISESFAGLLTNVYIASVPLYDYFKKANLSTSDKLIVALCVSNVYCALLNGVFLLTINMWPDINTDINIMGIFMTLQIFGISSSVWITVCLCLFYFIKIINFSSGPLGWMKMKINVVVPWLIVLSEVVALGCSLLTRIPSVIKEFYYNYSLDYFQTLNVTSRPNVIPIHYMSIYIIGLFVPLLTMLVITFVTAGSLYLHIRRMKKNMGTSSNSAAHQSVVWTMIRLLILYTAILVASLLYTLKIFTSTNFAFFTILMILYSFPLVASVILILGNPKLKKPLMTMYNC